MWRSSLIVAVAATCSAGAWWLGESERTALEDRLTALEQLERSGTEHEVWRAERVREIEARLADLLEIDARERRERDEAFGRIGTTEASVAKLAAELDARERRLAELEAAQRSLVLDEVTNRLDAVESTWTEVREAVSQTREELASRIQQDRTTLEELRARLGEPSPGPAELWHRFMGPVVQLSGDISVGSGVLLESQPIQGLPRTWRTYVMTAWHVVRDMQDDPVEPVTPVPVRIYLEDGRLRDETARVVAHDVTLDVALLELESTEAVPFGTKLPTPLFVESVRTFHPVVAVGCPLGTDPIPTEGQVSSIDHEVDGRSYWMINAPTYIGNSGGGVFDAHSGELLGIFSKIYNHGSIRPTIVPHMGLVTPMDQIYDWFTRNGYAVDGDGHLAQVPREKKSDGVAAVVKGE
ncbi:MAG: trypsin-like peptidase domain-containing protein [Planctomycetota bacterium]